MSASPVKSKPAVLAETAFKYLLVTILCALIGAVYELFSHEVYAYGMLYAFAFPLVGGMLPSLLLPKRGGGLPSGSSRLLWHFGISSLTVGSFFSGALEIYGTSSRLTAVYWLMGGVCLLMSLLTGLLLPGEEEKRIRTAGM